MKAATPPRVGWPLPVELTDHIIDYLQMDKTCMRATSLVCSTWCPRSRRHLFRTVHVKAVGRSFHRFFTFLQKKDSGRAILALPVSCYIQDLHLYGSSPRVTGDPDQVNSFVTVDLIASVFALLPELKQLSLEETQLQMRSFAATRQVPDPQFCYSLDSLSLKNVSTVSATGDDLPHMLSLFRSIGVLRVVTPFWPTFPVQPEEIAVNPPIPHKDSIFPSDLHISRLELRSRMLTPYMLGLIRRTPSIYNLRHIDIACRSLVDVQALGNFLQLAGPTIEHVTIDLVELFSRSPPRTPEELELFNLEACTSLNSLTFRIALLPDGNYGMYNTNMFLTASELIAKSSRTMQNVTFHIFLNGSLHDMSRIKFMLNGSMDTEFYWLRVAFQKLLPKFQTLGFIWEGLEDAVQSSTEVKKEIDTLSDIIRSKFAEFDEKGQLAFGHS